MKISAKWTDAERLQASNMIATEMMKAFNDNDISSLDVADWSQRLAFIALQPAEFLEDNRKSILDERYLREYWNSKQERDPQDFEHKADVRLIDSLIAEAGHLVKTDSGISGPGTPPLAKREQLKLFAKVINHQYAAWSALFELITGYKPPKMKEVAAIISGH